MTPDGALPVLSRQASSQSDRVKKKQREEFIQKVASVGFHLDVAEYASVKVQYRSVEEAIEFIVGKNDQDGLYIHDFVEFKERKCLLCGEELSHHRKPRSAVQSQKDEDEEVKRPLDDIDGMNFNIELFRNKSRSVAAKILEGVDPVHQDACQVCFEQRPEDLFFNGLGGECTHKYCLECVRGNLTVLINEAKILKIKCFNTECSRTFDDKDVKAVLMGDPDREALYLKYLKFKQAKLVESDPLVKWCPRPGCEKFARAENSFTRKVVCSCGQQICFKCGNPYHGWLFFFSCDRAIDQQFDAWAKDKDIRYCAMCKARIEKAEGCNHMTCYYCEYQFCWICGETYTRDHFAPLNPLGCGGMQFGQSSGVTNILSYVWVYTKRILFFLLILIIGPIALVFATPIFFAFLTIEGSRHCCGRRFSSLGCCSQILVVLLAILAFGVGIAADVIVVPLAIVLGIPIFVGINLYDRWKMRQNAKERLKTRINQAREIQLEIEQAQNEI